MTRLLITGGCGFVGAHVVEYFLRSTDCDIVVLDRLTYAASGFDRLHDIEAIATGRDFSDRSYDPNRVRVFTHDLSTPLPVGLARELGSFDYIIHMAGETHVDNSISDPIPFVVSNVVGMAHLLQFARTQTSLRMMLNFSTDEVFGPALDGENFSEWSRHRPTNPYAATKAAADDLAMAWAHTYHLRVATTFCMNIFGERQHREKYIPKCVHAALTGETLTIHADPTRTRAGTRFYIHARNVAAALHFLLTRAERGEKYNIVGEQEIDNLALAQMVARILNRPLNYELVDFHSSRPGHDLRYGLDGSRLAALGWTPSKTFEESLEKTVRWMTQPEHIRWLLTN